MAVRYRSFTLDGPHMIGKPTRVRRRKWITYSGVDGEATIDEGVRRTQLRIQSYIQAAAYTTAWKKMGALLDTHNTTAGTLCVHGQVFTEVYIDDRGPQFGPRFLKHLVKKGGSPPWTSNYMIPVNVTFLLPEGTFSAIL